MAENRDKDLILSESFLSGSIMSGDGSDLFLSIDAPVTNTDTVNFRQIENAPNVLPRSTERDIRMVPSSTCNPMVPSSTCNNTDTVNFWQIENAPNVLPRSTERAIRMVPSSTCNPEYPVQDNCKCGLNHCQLSRPDNCKNCILHISYCPQTIPKCCDCKAPEYSEQSQLCQVENSECSSSLIENSECSSSLIENSECSSSAREVFIQLSLDKLDRQEEFIKQREKTIAALWKMAKGQEDTMQKLVGQMALLQSSESSDNSSYSVAVSPDFNIDTVKNLYCQAPKNHKHSSVRGQTEYRSGSFLSDTDLDSEELDKDNVLKEVLPDLVPEFNLSENAMTIDIKEYLKKLQQKKLQQ